ncbi:MAG: pyruvate kinase [Gammaproteobacteria bacterium]|nr:pyruvate kinase [Gammaproteobacteria bacterium]
MRRTKVIATIGPACEDEDTLRQMIAAGMNVARLNLSHGSLVSHAGKLELVRRVADTMDANVGIMVDTRGREIRTGELTGGVAELERGQSFTLTSKPGAGNAQGVSVTHPCLHEHVSAGERILLDDGNLELRVEGVSGDLVRCRVEYGGTLRNSKGVNLPDNGTVFGAIDSQSDDDLEFAASCDTQYVAASFIRSADDVEEIRRKLRALGSDIPIIAKIENRSGVDNLDSIIAAADGTMVARGDLGVELGLARGPTIQKRIIRATVSNGKPVITATQMLDSMERNPRPTRAEASDVANAILDGTSAVMLSGETAVGAYPVESVRTIVSLTLEAEAGLRDFGFLQQILPNPSNVVTEAVAQASITMANHLQAAAIVALTETGFTSRLISKYRPGCPILAVTSSLAVMRRLSMNWGVETVRYEGAAGDEDKLRFAMAQTKALGYAKSGDVLVATAGSHSQAGSTDLIRVLTVD